MGNFWVSVSFDWTNQAAVAMASRCQTSAG